MIIDLDQIKEISISGIRRATVYLGLGVNAARDESFTKFDLPDNVFKFIPDKISSEDITGFRVNFEKWLIWNSLRELIESFGIFLDAVHQSCLLLATTKGRITSTNADSWGPDFEWAGVEKKLRFRKKGTGYFS